MSDGRCPRCLRKLETSDATCPYCVPVIVGNRTYTYPEMLKEFFPNDKNHGKKPRMAQCLECGKVFDQNETHNCFSMGKWVSNG